MTENIKKNWLQYVLLAAIFIILLLTNPFNCNDKGGNTTPVKSDTITLTERDTVFTEKISIIKEYVPLIKEALQNTDTVYHVHENYEGLVKQYKELAARHSTINKYEDTLNIDSFGRTILKYTVQNNVVKDFSGINQYTIPTITETKTVTITKTVTAPQRNKVFLGGEVIGDSRSFVNGAYGGILFENKRGNIYGLKGGIISADNTVKPSMGISAYWPIGKK